MQSSIFRTGQAETGRVEAFSDGVLAIVITLLVLEIKVPHVEGTDAALWSALAGMASKILAWVVSFSFVLVFWVAHHYFFRDLKHTDRGLLWLNGLFLLFVSFTPFPTALVGDYPLALPPLILLSGCMFLTAASFSLMRWYALHRGGLYGEEHHAGASRALRRSVVAPLLYSIGFGSAFLTPYAALTIQILVPLIFFLPARDERP